MPQRKARTALLRELKEAFRRFRSQPVERLIAEINPKLRGWVNYFRIGHASRCFAVVRLWVERRVRRHLMTARNRRGFGWKRWSTAWLHTTLGLFADYRVRYLVRALNEVHCVRIVPELSVTIGRQRAQSSLRRSQLLNSIQWCPDSFSLLPPASPGSPIDPARALA